MPPAPPSVTGSACCHERRADSPPAHRRPRRHRRGRPGQAWAVSLGLARCRSGWSPRRRPSPGPRRGAGPPRQHPYAAEHPDVVRMQELIHLQPARRVEDIRGRDPKTGDVDTTWFERTVDGSREIVFDAGHEDVRRNPSAWTRRQGDPYASARARRRSAAAKTKPNGPKRVGLYGLHVDRVVPGTELAPPLYDTRRVATELPRPSYALPIRSLKSLRVPVDMRSGVSPLRVDMPARVLRRSARRSSAPRWASRLGGSSWGAARAGTTRRCRCRRRSRRRERASRDGLLPAGRRPCDAPGATRARRVQGQADVGWRVPFPSAARAPVAQREGPPILGGDHGSCERGDRSDLAVRGALEHAVLRGRERDRRRARLSLVTTCGGRRRSRILPAITRAPGRSSVGRRAAR